MSLFKGIIGLWLLCLISGSSALAQNFTGINIQGQQDNLTAASIDLDFYVIDFATDTIWSESHSAVTVSAEGSYALTLGHGTFISGAVLSFELIDWYDVAKVVIRRTDVGPSVEIAEFTMMSMPFAMHSLTIEEVPATAGLEDVNGSSAQIGYLYKYNGSDFVISLDNLSDTSNYSHTAGTAVYVDTAMYGSSGQSWVDTSLYTLWADTVDYATQIGSVPLADSSLYADSVNSASVSLGNWRLDGNSGINPSQYIGTSTNHDLRLGTNNTARLIFGPNDSIYDSPIGKGFALNSENGVLIQTNSNSAIDNFTGSYLYFDGQRSSLSGGGDMQFDLDTTFGNYAFSWGRNVGTNGNNSTIFGYNSFGDSSLINGIWYNSISSFAVGKGNHVSYVGVAIGEDCKANYFRNVAIGKNVRATGIGSTALGIGYNILVTGATSWALGKNLEATANFSTVMGSYCSSGANTGSFMYGDASTTDTLYPMANHSFNARVSGGVVFYTSTDLLNGVTVAAGGGSWNMISDRNKKRDISLLNAMDYQEDFEALDILGWQYKSNPTRHIGPMAQDFYSLFNVGEYNTYINMIDIDGVTLMGIKLLKESLDETEVEEVDIEKTEEKINSEKTEFEELENRINTLYEKMD